MVGFEDGKALVETLFGLRKLKPVLAGELKEGDLVAVHYDYVCEKISREEFEFLKKKLAEALGAVDQSLLH